MSGFREGTTRGFRPASALLRKRIAEASEKRGFAVARLLTHWDEIAGADLAPLARPVEISYGRGGLGATLTLLTSGAHAPVVEMQKELLRERVNGVYGYNAIRRIRITQTSATGFGEAQTPFTRRAGASAAREPAPEVSARARGTVRDIRDSGLRDALEKLAANVMSRRGRAPSR